jgi:hypothetical protein
MHCPACGIEAIEQAIYCHKCGHRLDSSEAAPADAGKKAFEEAATARQDTEPPTEEELWRGGYSSKAMVGAWVICGAVTSILAILGIWQVRSAVGILILFVLILLPWIYNVSVLMYRRMSVHYVLTNQRFIHEHGLLRRINGRIELLDVDDITLEQGVCERLMGVGTIRIVSHDRSDPDISLPGIDDVKNVTTIFDNARLVERRRRGLHVENI